MYYANCHFHSTHSDGGFRPLMLARIAYGMGYRAVALTDHDVISGTSEIMKEAASLGMECMTGVEITCRLKGDHSPEDIGFHLVGLGMDTEYPKLRSFIDQLCEWRNEHTRALFDRGVRLGLLEDITWEEVERYNPGCRWFCNEQVFRAMEMTGHFDIRRQAELFPKVFRGGFASSIGIFIKEPSISEAIGMIREAGGIPVLAHPHRTAKYIPFLVEQGLLGVEVRHPDLDDEDVPLVLEAAEAYGLYRSGGSDHSGIMGGCGLPHTPDYGWGTSEEDFHDMLYRRKK